MALSVRCSNGSSGSQSSRATRGDLCVIVVVVPSARVAVVVPSVPVVAGSPAPGLAGLAGVACSRSVTGCNVLCRRPFRTVVGEFGCGQCLPCRVNKRREWSSRILLESHTHKASVFATLTIADVPKGHCGPPQRRAWELLPKDFTLFMKRLRANYPEPIRYFAVGEYGDLTFRPHYHAALFGVSLMDSEVVKEAWGLGSIHLGELNKDSAQYLAGYVTKKMTKKEDERLAGRCPEVARMSRRPGIGVPALAVLKGSIDLHGGNPGIDVPTSIRVGGKTLPIGRTLRTRFRVLMGMAPEEPQAAKRLRAAEFQADDKAARETRRETNYKQAHFRASLARSKQRL